MELSPVNPWSLASQADLASFPTSSLSLSQARVVQLQIFLVRFVNESAEVEGFLYFSFADLKEYPTLSTSSWSLNNAGQFMACV